MSSPSQPAGPPAAVGTTIQSRLYHKSPIQQHRRTAAPPKTTRARAQVNEPKRRWGVLDRAPSYHSGSPLSLRLLRLAVLCTRVCRSSMCARVKPTPHTSQQNDDAGASEGVPAARAGDRLDESSRGPLLLRTAAAAPLSCRSSRTSFVSFASFAPIVSATPTPLLPGGSELSQNSAASS